MEQRSETWHEQRAGMFTASTFAALMKNGRAKDTPGETCETLILQTVAEALTGTTAGAYSAAIAWGLETEAEAFGYVQNRHKADDFKDAIFMEYKGPVKELHGYVGATPDGIGKRLLEIKCPFNQAKHLERVINPMALLDECKWQVLGQLYVAGYTEGLLCSYDPRFPKGAKLVEVEVNINDYTEDIAALEARLLYAVGRFKEIMVLYKERPGAELVVNQNLQIK